MLIASNLFFLASFTYGIVVGYVWSALTTRDKIYVVVLLFILLLIANGVIKWNFCW